MQQSGKKITTKQLVVLALIVLLYLLFALHIYHKFISEGTVTNLNSEKLTVTQQLKTGDVIVQKFRPQKNMSSLILYFATYANGQNGQGNLKIELQDCDTGKVLAQTNLDTRLLYDQMEYKFEFDVDGLENKDTAVVIEAGELAREATISLYLGEMNKQVDSACSYNDTELENALRMDYSFVEFGYMEKIIVCCLAIFLILIVAVYIMLVVRKSAIHNVYLVTVLMLGFVYMLLLPEFATPDEGTHIQKAIQLSNSVLGYDNSSDNFERRECEAEHFEVNLSKMNRESYEYYYSNLLHGDNSGELTGIEYEPITTPKYQYFLAAAGITAGRLLDLNGLQTFMIGMLLNFAFYVVVTYFALKIMPFGRVTAAIVCLLPISLQQATSYSYDCMLIAVSVMFMAAFLKVVHDKKCGKRYYIIFAISILMFLPAKQLAYISILLLAGYAVFVKVKDRLSRKTWIIISGCAAGAIVLAVGAFAFMRMGSTGDGQAAVPYIEWAAQPGYSLGALLSQPLDTIDIFWKTLFTQGDFYFLSTFGAKLGWLNINVSIIAVCIYLVTAVVSVMPDNGNNIVRMKGSLRIVLLLVFLLTLGCVMGGMLLGWSPVSGDYIQGVQGRYILPVLLMGIFALRSNDIRITKRLKRLCLMLAIAVQPLTLAGVLYSM